jgi:hypothetical protein
MKGGTIPLKQHDALTEAPLMIGAATATRITV